MSTQNYIDEVYGKAKERIASFFQSEERSLPPRVSAVMRFVDTGDGYIATCRDTIWGFATDSFAFPSVPSTAEINLEEQIRGLLDRGGNYIIVIKEIIGYASKSGSEQRNLELAKKRAESTYNYLMDFVSRNELDVGTRTDRTFVLIDSQTKRTAGGVRTINGVDEVDHNNPIARSVDILYSLTYTYPPPSPDSISTTIFSIDFGNAEVAAVLPFITYIGKAGENAKLTFHPDGENYFGEPFEVEYKGTVFTYPVLTGPGKKKKIDTPDIAPEQIAWTLEDKIKRLFRLSTFRAKMQQAKDYFVNNNNNEAAKAILEWLIGALPKAEIDVPSWDDVKCKLFGECSPGNAPPPDVNDIVSGFVTNTPFSRNQMESLFLFGVELTFSFGDLFNLHVAVMFMSLDQPYSIIVITKGINIQVPGEAVINGVFGRENTEDPADQQKSRLRKTASSIAGLVEVEMAIKAVQLNKV